MSNTTIARARAFELMGSLLLGERAAVARARSVSPFDQMMRGEHEAELAAEHYCVFALEAFPYAGVFTEDEALVGGRIANRVTRTLDSMGALEAHGDESPDHVGNILRAIGMLVHRNRIDDAARLGRECLLPWIVPWATAVARQRGALWRFVVEVCIALVGEMSEGVAPAALESGDPFVVSDSTGLAQIASALTTPTCAGAFLCREDIRALGRRLELPTGFGSRRLMLTNLLRSAAEYQSGAVALTALATFFCEESVAMKQLAGSTPGIHPDAAAGWSERALATAGCLDSMKIELASAQPAVG